MNIDINVPDGESGNYKIEIFTVTKEVAKKLNFSFNEK
jgi:hypothetical protein